MKSLRALKTCVDDKLRVSRWVANDERRLASGYIWFKKFIVSTQDEETHNNRTDPTEPCKTHNGHLLFVTALLFQGNGAFLFRGVNLTELNKLMPAACLFHTRLTFSLRFKTSILFCTSSLLSRIIPKQYVYLNILIQYHYVVIMTWVVDI